MTVGLGFQGGVIAVGEESTWGTAVAPTKAIEIISEGINVAEERLHSGAIPQIYTDDDEVSKGAVTVSGEAEIETRWEGQELLLKHAMGGAASAEATSFVITLNTNDFIDFIEESGSELSAQITAGTYSLGADSSVAGSLCKAIKDAMELVGDGTYTVTHNTSTHIITIAVSGSKVTFKMLGSTGTNKTKSAMTTLGYAMTDQTLAASQVAGTAVVPVYTHTFTLTDALPTGLTIEVDKDTTAFLVEGGKINTFSMAIEYGNFLKTKIGIIGEDMTTTTVTALTPSTSPLITFAQGSISYAGSTVQVTQASFSLNNNLKADRRFIGSRLIAEPTRSKKIEVNGTIQLEFDGVAQYNDFRAATSRALVLTFTGETSAIKTGYSYSMVITFPVIKLTAAMPKFNAEGPLTIDLPFKAYASSGAAREFNIVLTNKIVSV